MFNIKVTDTTNILKEDLEDKVRKAMDRLWSSRASKIANDFRIDLINRINSGEFGVKTETTALINSIQVVNRNRNFWQEVGIKFRGGEKVPHLNTQVRANGESAVQTIRVKNAEYLFVPLSAGKSSTGIAWKNRSVTPSSFILDIFAVKGKLYGVEKVPSGTSKRGRTKYANNFIYVLKKSVKVPRRINVSYLETELTMMVQDAYMDTLNEVLKREL